MGKREREEKERERKIRETERNGTEYNEYTDAFSPYGRPPKPFLVTRESPSRGQIALGPPLSLPHGRNAFNSKEKKHSYHFILVKREINKNKNKTRKKY